MSKITLIGSTKFKKEFHEVKQMLEKEGHTVYAPFIFSHADNIKLEDYQITALDTIHRGWIQDSDICYVIDKDGYIGESSTNEMIIAQSLGKKIMLYSDEIEKQDNRIFFKIIEVISKVLSKMKNININGLVFSNIKNTWIFTILINGKRISFDITDLNNNELDIESDLFEMYLCNSIYARLGQDYVV